MNKIKMMSSAAVLFGVLGLAACGGGGGGGTDVTTDPTTDPTTSSTTTGVITGFGSVFVNGVEYETGGASVSLDGSSGSESGLRVGMVVKVQGTANGAQGTATSIAFADAVEGVVLAASIAADGTGTLDVMGQSVTLDAKTVFESNDPDIATAALIAPGNVVEVSGYASGTGEIYATRVEVKSATLAQYQAEHQEQIEVKGVIANLDPQAETFTLGAASTLTIAYGGAALDLSGQTLRDGLYVEVKSAAGVDPDSGNLVASKVEIEDGGDMGVDGEEGDDVGVKGKVTAVTSAEEFQVNGQTVVITGTTEFENGSAQAIDTGVMLEVEGRLDAAGNLVADQIKFEQEDDVEIQGYVDAVDSANGTVTVLGRTISITASTLIEDDAHHQERVADFMGSLAAGDRVELHAYVNTQTQAMIATKLQREEAGADEPAQLQGPVEDASAAGVLVVAGITVQTEFAAVVGQMVEIEGTYTNGTLVASSVQLAEAD